jgi:hypothetical protein
VAQLQLEWSPSFAIDLSSIAPYAADSRDVIDALPPDRQD